MGFYQSTRFCRWCSKAYQTSKATDRDGFCCDNHRQALYRARKRAVTNVARYARSKKKMRNARGKGKKK